MTMRNKILLNGLAGLLLLAAIPALQADEDATLYDRVRLAVSAEQQVSNDTLVAVLYVQTEGTNTAALANEVNRKMGWAIGQAKLADGVKSQTLDYRTNPIYRKQVLTGWRVRQSLRLESNDSTKLSDLIGTLQKQLAVESISYQVSSAARKVAQDELIEQALTDFRARAALVAKAWQRPSYRLVELNITSGGNIPQPRQMRMMAMEMAADAVSAPPLQAGTQQVQVNVSGVVELTP
jgi:predicted secreted protein